MRSSATEQAINCVIDLIAGPLSWWSREPYLNDCPTDSLRLDIEEVIIGFMCRLIPHIILDQIVHKK